MFNPDEFAARVVARIADGLCPSCARGYHINHVTDWRPSVLDGEVVNGAGDCTGDDDTGCPCEWRS